MRSILAQVTLAVEFVLLFVLAAGLWAILNELVRRWKIDPLRLTVALAMWSPVFLPIWLVFNAGGLMKVGLPMIALQMIYGWSSNDLYYAANTPPPPPPAEAGVFALRQRSAIFGHNAPKWASLPQFVEGQTNLMTGAVGVFAGIVLAMLNADAFWIAQALLAAWVLAQVIEGVTTLVLYRRGI